LLVSSGDAAGGGASLEPEQPERLASENAIKPNNKAILIEVDPGRTGRMKF